MAAYNYKEVEDFISKVDKIESVIKGLSSGDANLEAQSAKKADEILGREEKAKSTSSGFEKTQINKYEDKHVNNRLPEQENNALQFNEESISPDDFMKRVELDAAERKQRKERNNKVANELKEKGNIAFKRKDHDEAIKYYDEAISIIRDNTALYTNRAQAYIHTGKYNEALKDCLTAQQIDRKCIKAIIHQGRALQHLKRFEEAIKCFDQVKEIDKRHKNLVAGYVEETLKLQELHEKEQKSISLEQSGDKRAGNIQESINRLRREEVSLASLNQILKELKSNIDKDVYRTLFRTNGGFKMLNENPTMHRLLKKDENHKEEEFQSIICILDLTFSVCLESEENTKELLHPSMFQCLTKLIQSRFPLDIRAAAAKLVQIISQFKEGREFLLGVKENESILEELLSLLSSNDDTAAIAVGAINNLALYDGLSEESSRKIAAKFVPFLTTMMEVFSSIEEGTSQMASVITLVTKTITTLTNLAKDLTIRKMLAADKHLCKTSAQLIASYERFLEDESKKELVNCLLGLLMNLSLVENFAALDICKHMNDICCRLINCKYYEIGERAAGLLNHLMTSCTELIQYNIEMKSCTKFTSTLKGSNMAAKNFIIKCIALCSAQDASIAKDLRLHKATKSLLTLLSSESETVIGNSTLTIAHCANDKVFSEDLTSTNIIQDLLKIATHDDYKNTVKHNAAIAIGKLATVHPRHLERLRELHGMEILHQVMKENQKK